jgi:hypothetical protein
MVINQFYFSTFSPAHEIILQKKIDHTIVHLTKLSSQSTDTLTLLPTLSFSAVHQLLDKFYGSPANLALLHNTQVLLSMPTAPALGTLGTFPQPPTASHQHTMAPSALLTQQHQ